MMKIFLALSLLVQTASAAYIPYLPSAQANSTAGQGVGASSAALVQFNNEEWDDDSSYDPTTFQWTSKYVGRVEVSSRVQWLSATWGSAGSGATAACNLRKNGTTFRNFSVPTLNNTQLQSIGCILNGAVVDVVVGTVLDIQIINSDSNNGTHSLSTSGAFVWVNYRFVKIN